jgi:hypothetical protein
MSFALLTACSIAAFAQKDDDRKPPKKENPPVINPAPKPSPKPERPRRPEYISAVSKDVTDTTA